jgi:hypothetical protein
MHQDYLDIMKPPRTSRGTGRRRTGNRVDDVNFNFRSTRQIRLDNAKRATQWELPTLGDQIHGHTNTGMCIGNSNPRKPYQRNMGNDTPVRVTGDNDEATIRKCMVLDCPIRRWDESRHQTSGNSRRDFVDVRGKLAGPPPGTDTLGIGPGLAAWEVNAEVLLDSGASRDFVNKRTVMKRGWKMEDAAHAIDVQMADGRVLSLDKVSAVELQLAPGRIYRTKAYGMPMGGALDDILGMTWWSSSDCVQFYWAHNPKQVKATMDDQEFTLTGKTVQEERESPKLINDHMRGLGFEHEVISAEQGAEDLKVLEVLAREAAKNGNTDAAMPYLFWLAQISEPDDEGDAPPGSVELWREQAYSCFPAPRRMDNSQQNSTECLRSYSEKVNIRCYTWTHPKPYPG